MSGTFFIRMKGECFFYEFRFHGLNFPSIGPATQMNAVKWEPSTENMYACDRDGVLKGDVKLTVVGGGCHYRCLQKYFKVSFLCV